MLQRAAQWRLLAIAGGLSLLILYLYGLDRMGLYSTDEPRYASIGREMARSGDYITPRLWGEAWFEKPALLYWMIAAGFRAGLSNDLAPRVPVALFSLAFLGVFFWMLRREFGAIAASYSTAILATSAGWLALSDIAITDIPMSAAFGLALLFTLPWLRSGDRRWLNAAAAMLGLAFLAKSGPPLVLSLPVLWFGRDRWRDLVRPAPVLLFLLIATPWYIACTLQNGTAFLWTLFWVHQVSRFVSAGLQHVQKWWFYIPWLPVLWFPWTPVLALLIRRDLYSDKRVRFLAVTSVWGFVFFSASLNKLPLYLLPLFPPIAVLMGVAIEKAQLAARVAIISSALVCCAFPVLVTKLPELMSKNPQAGAPRMPVMLAVIMLLAIAAVCFIRNRAGSVTLVTLMAAAGYLWIKVETLPFIDIAATARPVGRQVESIHVPVCAQDVPRELRYGLNYYAERPLPDCRTGHVTGAFVSYRNRVLTLQLSPP